MQQSRTTDDVGKNKTLVYPEQTFNFNSISSSDY